MNWEKIINWDEVPKEYVCAVTYNGSVINFQKTDDICLCAGQELIKRPIKLEDGKWYTFAEGGVRLVGVYYKKENVLCVDGEGVDPGTVKIHKKLTDDMWE